MIQYVPSLTIPRIEQLDGSSGTAYAKSYGVIVGADRVEYIHSSTGSYYRANDPRWETWRSDLGHSSIPERSAPADVLVIWDRQRGIVVSQTSPPTTPPVIVTLPTASNPAPILIAGTGPTTAYDGTMNVDRPATDGSSTPRPAPPSAGPSTNTMLDPNAPQLAPASRINWLLVIGATLGLGALLWFFGGKRRKGAA